MNLNMMSKVAVVFKGWAVCFTRRLIGQSLHKSLVKVILIVCIFVPHATIISKCHSTVTYWFIREGSPIYSPFMGLVVSSCTVTESLVPFDNPPNISLLVLQISLFFFSFSKYH